MTHKEAPPGAYPPGTQLTVGSHAVTIKKYISEGGFAHVYTCDISPDFRGSSVACLKRVAVPDKPSLNLLRCEVDAMVSSIRGVMKAECGQRGLEHRG
jgi:AP2-associated kinase